MHVDDKSWSETNVDVANFLDHLSRSGPPTISRLILDEYQIALFIDSLQVWVSTEIQLFEDGRLICSMVADHRNRSHSSFGVCVVVGREVAKVQIGDSGIRYSFQDGSELLCVRADEFENYSIEGIPNTPAFF